MITKLKNIKPKHIADAILGLLIIATPTIALYLTWDWQPFVMKARIDKLESSIFVIQLELRELKKHK